MPSETKVAPDPNEVNGVRASTRTGAVMEAIRLKLATRALAPGEKLPSIRGVATTLNVSPSTVVEACDRLAARG